MVQSSNAEGSRLNLRIKFRSETLENFVERYGSDVTTGGIFIRSKQPLPVGTKVAFTLSLINGIPVFVGEGTVVWVRAPEAENAAGNPGMGLRFDELNDESRMKLSRVLAVKAERDKAGKPSVRGPTPIPDASPESGFPGSSDATAKVRLTQDGRLVRDMPMVAAAPVPGPAAPVPSSPYAASLSRPQGTAPARRASPSPGTDDTLVTAPTGARVQRQTPAVAEEPAQPFGPSKTLGETRSPVATTGPTVVRAPKGPATPPPLKRGPTPAFGSPPSTRPAAGSPFSSTVAFASPAPRARPPSPPAIPPRGPTPAPDLLRRATPPPAPLAAPSSVFSRPTPVPSTLLHEGRSGARTGPVVNRISSARPAVPPAQAASDWGQENTEIAATLPSFDEGDEKTTTVRGQTLAAAQGFAATDVDVGRRLQPRVNAPAAFGAGPSEPPSVPPRPSANQSTAGLTNLFEGESFPDPAAASLRRGELDMEFGRMDSSGRARGITPGPTASTSMVARRGEVTEVRQGRRRTALWLTLGVVAMGGIVFGLVRFMNGNKLPGHYWSSHSTMAEAPGVAPGLEHAGGAGAEATAAEATPPAPPAAEPAAPAPTAGGQADPAAKVGKAAEPAARTAEPAARPAQPAAPAAPAAQPAAEPAARTAQPAPRAAEPPPITAAAKPNKAKRPAAAPRPARPAGGALALEETGEAEAIYWLRVRSSPPGADVLIDGQLEGQTPFQRRIFDPSRAYALSIRKEGFESHERMLSASDSWVKQKNENLLTVIVKLRSIPGAAPTPQPGETPAVPPIVPDP